MPSVPDGGWAEAGVLGSRPASTRLPSWFIVACGGAALQPKMLSAINPAKTSELAMGNDAPAVFVEWLMIYVSSTAYQYADR